MGRRRGIVVIAVCALFALACGSDGDENAGSAGSAGKGGSGGGAGKGGSAGGGTGGGSGSGGSGGGVVPELPLLDQVSQFGITWTFDKKVPVGQFVNGDYYVVGPVTVVKIDPAPANGRN